jgi:hypothetical protein
LIKVEDVLARLSNLENTLLDVLDRNTKLEAELKQHAEMLQGLSSASCHLTGTELKAFNPIKLGV